MSIRNLDFSKANYMISIHMVESQDTAICEPLKTLTENSLKAYFHVWDNFWQLKALQKWWKCFLLHHKISSCS